MIMNQQFTTVNCDAPGCGKTATFEYTKNGILDTDMEKNPWLKTNMVISLADNRTFSACSPACAVNMAAAGLFDPIAPKTIESVTGGTAAIAAAAAAARRQEIADKNIREGAPVQVALK